MDACYGKNVLGKSWADDVDEDDEFEMEVCAPTRVYESEDKYDGGDSEENYDEGDDKYEECNEGDSDDDYDENGEVYETYPTVEEGEALFVDEQDSCVSLPAPNTTPQECEDEIEEFDPRDLPPRPDTPEPTCREDLYDESTPTNVDYTNQIDYTYAGEEDYPTHFQNRGQLPGEHAFYLQVPFPYSVATSLPIHFFDTPQTIPKLAHEELLWENQGMSYTQAWMDTKWVRGVPLGETMMFRASPLRQEVRFDEETEGEYEFECDGCEGEVADENEDDFAVEACEGVDGSSAGSISFTYPDELADSGNGTEDPSSASVTETGQSKSTKRDSFHDDQREVETGLLPGDEDPMRSTTPESEVIVSTDDEVSVDEDRPEDSDEDEIINPSPKMSPILPTSTQEERTTSNTEIVHADEAKEEKMLYLQTASIQKKLPVVSIAHVKGLRLPALDKPAIFGLVRPSASSPPASEDEDLARRLKMRYALRHSDRKRSCRFGSGILSALAQFSRFPVV